MVDLHITGRLLIGVDRKLKPVELCSQTPAHKLSNELMRSMVHHNNSRARWVLVVYLLCHIGACALLHSHRSSHMSCTHALQSVLLGQAAV